MAFRPACLDPEERVVGDAEKYSLHVPSIPRTIAFAESGHQVPKCATHSRKEELLEAGEKHS